MFLGGCKPLFLYVLVRKGCDDTSLALDCEIEYAPQAIDEVTSSPGLWVEVPLSRS